MIYLHDHKVLSIGPREWVINDLKMNHGIEVNTDELGTFRDGLFGGVWGGVDQFGVRASPAVGGVSPKDKARTSDQKKLGKVNDDKEALISMDDISIQYGFPPQTRPILKDFTWTIRRGEKWGIFGPNGSGKTTLLSLITSDHPQAYSQRITYFSHPRSRPGLPIFDIQKRIGHSSPEIHSFFPRHLGVRRTVESAWSETFLMRPEMPSWGSGAVAAIFEFFGEFLGGGISGARFIEQRRGKKEEIEFGDLSIAQQRLLLFMRAVVKRPDLVILDEAFAGMEERLRSRCLEWLENGDGFKDRGEAGLSEHQALVVVSHVEEEVPRGVNRWVRLAGGALRAEFGVV